MSNSPAMLADALHSLSDLLSDAVAMWAFVMLVPSSPTLSSLPHFHLCYLFVFSLKICNNNCP
jgi:hypothetical protein